MKNKEHDRMDGCTRCYYFNSSDDTYPCVKCRGTQITNHNEYPDLFTTKPYIMSSIKGGSTLLNFIFGFVLGVEFIVVLAVIVAFNDNDKHRKE